MADRRGDWLQPLHGTLDRLRFDILVLAGDSLLDSS
jgi:hypothetical protein